MDDRVKQLRRLEELEATDLWERIRGAHGDERSHAAGRARRLATAAFAIVIAIAGVGASLFALSPREGPPGSVTPGTNGPLIIVRMERSDSPYGGPTSVWSIQPDGSDLREIEQPVPREDPLQSFRPRWSPDGSRVLWWAGDGHFSTGSIWTDVPGRGLVPIVTCDQPSCGIWDPDWSPDGTRIAFARGMTVVTVEPDGSGARELARCPGCTDMESGPAWSPDGSRIAFAASDADYHGAIFVMNSDGSDLTRVFDCGSELCKGGLRAAFLDWSPTSDRLVFTLERNVWTMLPDGSELRRLTSCPVTEGRNACEPGVVTWSPDGTKIAYQHGSGGLVIMGADGSDPREIGPGGQLSLDSWQPLPARRDDEATPGALAAGTSSGTQWSLVVATGPESNGVELRWNDAQSRPQSQFLEREPGLAVGWREFGRFDPDDAVIFGITPPGVSSVTHIPGQGLPGTDVDVIDVPGADWGAFVLMTYAAIGIVEGNEPGKADPLEVLIVPPGGEPVLDTVEAFLAARIAGDSAERYLAPGAASEFGRNGIAPLYRGRDGGAYVRSKVLFLSTAGDTWEVGVRLEANDGTTAEDTLFVSQTRDGRYNIIGLRGGTIGP
jgi:hypothetical protein